MLEPVGAQGRAVVSERSSRCTHCVISVSSLGCVSPPSRRSCANRLEAEHALADAAVATLEMRSSSPIIVSGEVDFERIDGDPTGCAAIPRRSGNQIERRLAFGGGPWISHEVA